jgi:uncharacterized protein
VSSKGKRTACFISRPNNGKLAVDMKSKCPKCNKIMDEASRQASRVGNFYPFCSNRCKLIDLGKWLDADYKIPAIEDDGKTGENENERDRQDKTEND